MKRKGGAVAPSAVAAAAGSGASKMLTLPRSGWVASAVALIAGLSSNCIAQALPAAQGLLPAACQQAAPLDNQCMRVATGFKGNKQALPHKLCVACGRVMVWRKAWAKNWAEVRYCSDACRRRGASPASR